MASGPYAGSYWCVYEITLNGFSFPSGGGATANGHEWSSDYTAAKAFDGNTSTAWHSKANGSFPISIGYDFTTSKTASSITLNQAWWPATSVQVLGSNDNVNWTDLGTFSGLTNGLNTLSLGSNQTFRYWVLKGLAGSSVASGPYAGSYWCVYEIGL